MEFFTENVLLWIVYVIFSDANTTAGRQSHYLRSFTEWKISYKEAITNAQIQ